MSVLDKLIGLATVGSSISSAYQLKRLMPKIVKAVVLAVLTSMMAMFLAAACLGAFYLGLVNAGYDPLEAMLIIGGLLLLVTLAFLGLTLKHFFVVRENMHHVLRPKIPIASSVQDIIEAFLDGFLSKPKDK
jgi:hypothetical protein